MQKHNIEVSFKSRAWKWAPKGIAQKHAKKT